MNGQNANTGWPAATAWPATARLPGLPGLARKNTEAEQPASAAWERRMRRATSGTARDPPASQRTDAPARAAMKTEHTAEPDQAPAPAGEKQAKTKRDECPWGTLSADWMTD